MRTTTGSFQILELSPQHSPAQPGIAADTCDGVQLRSRAGILERGVEPTNRRRQRSGRQPPLFNRASATQKVDTAQRTGLTQVEGGICGVTSASEHGGRIIHPEDDNFLRDDFGASGETLENYVFSLIADTSSRSRQRATSSKPPFFLTSARTASRYSGWTSRGYKRNHWYLSIRRSAS